MDIEFVRPLHDFSVATARVLTPDELVRMNQMESGQRLGAFFRAWTCKEAIVKAAGGRLIDAIQGFSVDLRPGKPVLILDKDLARLWKLYDVAVPDGWSAALAADTPFLTIRMRAISITGQTTLY